MTHLLDRSDDSEDVIVVTEEGVKGVGKPHTQVSPAQDISTLHQKHIFHFV